MGRCVVVECEDPVGMPLEGSDAGEGGGIELLDQAVCGGREDLIAAHKQAEDILGESVWNILGVALPWQSAPPCLRRPPIPP